MNDTKLDKNIEVDIFDYTKNAEKAMYSVIHHDNFGRNDVKLIYNQLEDKLVSIPFCDYLKRYIFKKAQLHGNPKDIPMQEYVDIIRCSFIENGVPASFSATTTKLSSLVKNLLTQKKVRRNVIFLLGFSLKMSEADVNNFLIKSLHEAKINPNNPFEVICAYCYRNKLTYSQYERLWSMYKKISVNSDASLLSENTAANLHMMNYINNENTLFLYLCNLKVPDGGCSFSRSAKKYFERLYDEVRRLIAVVYNNEKQKGSDNYKVASRKFTYKDITPADIESMLYAEVPLDKNGNLVSNKNSTLCRNFWDKRFSRQRINTIISGSTPINRFDLITLNFLIYALKVDDFTEEDNRYISFINSTNAILTGCNMGKLYVANPYENFILMCILSEYPLGTYNEVFGMSYEVL